MTSAAMSVLVHGFWCTPVPIAVGYLRVELWAMECACVERHCQSGHAISSILITVSLSASKTSKRSCPAGSWLHGSEESIKKLGLEMSLGGH